MTGEGAVSKSARGFAMLLAAVFLTGAAAHGQAPARLTLKQAVETALAKNPGIQAAGDYAQAVEKGIAVARAGRLPHLSFSEGFTRGNNPVYVFGSLLTQRQFSAANFALGFLNVPPPLDNFRTAFTAQMPLFDAGQTRRRIENARLEAKGAHQSLDRTRQEVIFRVIGAYLNEALARENVRVAETEVKSAQADLKRAKARQAQGQTVLSDVLSMQAHLAQAREDLIRARNAQAVAHAALNVAMGVDEAAPHTVLQALKETQFPAGTLAEQQARALQSRPDYLRVLVGERQAKNGVASARAQFLPRVDLFSSWETDRQTFAGRGGNNWTAGATLSFDVFDGGARRARLAASHAQERMAQARRTAMASQVRLQVREAYLNMDAARQRVAVTRDAAAQAEESLRILQNRYGAGLATITDLLRAETMRTAAQENHLNALFDYRLAFAALDLSTGELGPQSPAVTD